MQQNHKKTCEVRGPILELELADIAFCQSFHTLTLQKSKPYSINRWYIVTNKGWVTSCSHVKKGNIEHRELKIILGQDCDLIFSLLM